MSGVGFVLCMLAAWFVIGFLTASAFGTAVREPHDHWKRTR